ncbi:hypothetical protein L1987_59010 [Smallanthus sonchifolius]|uniref:Uncharacterized protein n=1 Tax=Smallanthus sonchifolius TaxID=185202 RepID=A0ACB9D405_9ASTR|nr:hypothetical protein L1987_59010 [Smallanthus sonchifolius]
MPRSSSKYLIEWFPEPEREFHKWKKEAEEELVTTVGDQEVIIQWLSERRVIRRTSGWRFFYNGLQPLKRQTVDASAGGSFLKQTPENAYALLEDLAITSHQWPTARSKSQSKGVHKVEEYVALSGKFGALSSKTDNMQVNKIQQSCEYCHGPLEKANLLNRVDEYERRLGCRAVRIHWRREIIVGGGEEESRGKEEVV